MRLPVYFRYSGRMPIAKFSLRHETCQHWFNSTIAPQPKSEWTVEEGGDGDWYAGTIVALYPGGGRATVEYDDGELAALEAMMG